MTLPREVDTTGGFKFPTFLSCSTCGGCLARRGTWSGTGLLRAICERFLQRLNGFGFHLINTWKSKVSFPLTTRGKHIVDSKGRVVRLRCVNWHLALRQDIFADPAQRKPEDSRPEHFIKCLGHVTLFEFVIYQSSFFHHPQIHELHFDTFLVLDFCG